MEKESKFPLVRFPSTGVYEDTKDTFDCGTSTLMHRICAMRNSGNLEEDTIKAAWRVKTLNHILATYNWEWLGATDTHNNTALQVAFQSQRPALVRILLVHGADKENLKVQYNYYRTMHRFGVMWRLLRDLFEPEMPY